MTPNTILWIYIALLVAGGLIGFLKARSKMSLIMSVAFAIPLALCASGIIQSPYVLNALVLVLLVFFSVRFAKSKKFMPNGLMAILSLAMWLVLALMKK